MQVAVVRFQKKKEKRQQILAMEVSFYQTFSSDVCKVNGSSFSLGKRHIRNFTKA